MTSHYEVWLRGKREGVFARERGARSYAIELAHECVAYCAVYDCQAGRVTEVFDPSGRRLTFPIAQAIAYAALACMARISGHMNGYEMGLATCKYRQVARKLEEVEAEKEEVQTLADELLEDWGNRTC